MLKRERVICSLNIRFYQIINLFKHLIAFPTQPLLQDLVHYATKCSSKFFGGLSIRFEFATFVVDVTVVVVPYQSPNAVVAGGGNPPLARA